MAARLSPARRAGASDDRQRQQLLNPSARSRAARVGVMTGAVVLAAGRQAGAGPKYELTFRDRLVVTRPAAHRPHPRGARRGLRRRFLDRRPGDRRDPHGARGARLRRARPARPTATDTGGRVRVRRGRGRRAAAGRCRDPGPPLEGGQVRTPGVRLGQAQAEHHQDHHVQRRAAPDAVLRCGAARPNARPGRRKHRGHREQFRQRAPASRPRSTPAIAAWPRSSPHQVSLLPKKPTDDACEGDRRAWHEPDAGSPRRGSASNTSMPSYASQWAPMRNSSDAVRPAHRPTGQSPA